MWCTSGLLSSLRRWFRYLDQILSFVILRDVCVQVLETGGLAKAEDLIMNKSVSDRVELVNIVGDQATFVRNILRDKVVSAEGHSYSNDAIRDKNAISVEEFAEVRERVISADRVRSELADVVRGRIPVDEDLGLGHFEGHSSVLRDIAGEPGKKRKHDTELCG
jgi:hypothetical protein